MQELFFLALQHLFHGNTRPSRYDIGNIVGVDLFFNHGTTTLLLFQAGLNFFYLVLLSTDFSITYLRHFFIIAFPLGTVGLETQVFYFYLVLLYLIVQTAFCFPFGFKTGFFFFQVGNLFCQRRKFRLIIFTFDGFPFYFELLDTARYFVEFLRDRINFETQLGSGFVHQIDCLVGKKTIGNIPLGQFHGSNDSIVFDTYFMMVFISLFQTTQNRDCT